MPGQNHIKLEEESIEKYVAVLWCFCAGTIDPVPPSPPHSKGGLHFAVAVVLKGTASSQFHVHRSCWFRQSFLLYSLTVFPSCSI